jgi:WD40 repeat protein
MQVGSRVLRGHEAVVNTLRFSPDGSRLATASSDGTVKLWDLSTGNVIRVLRGHTAAVWGLSFDPKGRLLASGSEDRTIRLWRVRTGAQIRVLAGHAHRVWGLAFSPDGRRLASGSLDRSIRIWDPRTGEGRVLARLEGRVYQLAFSPDGERLGVALSDNTARIIDLGREEEGGRAVVLRGHQSEVNSFAFSPDGLLAVTTGDDGTVRLWEAATGRPMWRAPLMIGSPPVLLANGRWISLGADRPARRPPAGGWREAVKRSAVHASADEEAGLLCFWSQEGQLKLWRLGAGRGEDGELAAWQVASIAQVLAFPGGCLTRDRAGLVRLHPRDRSRAKSSLLDRQATVVAWDHGEILIASRRQVTIRGPDGELRATVAADPGVTAAGRIGGRLLLGYADGNIEMRSVETRLQQPSLSFEDVPSSSVVRLAAGPMGTAVAGFANGVLGLWDLKNGARLHHGQLHGPVVHLLLRQRRIYAASELGSHLVWDLSALHEGYCSMLRRVWRKVPVVWQGGLPVFRAPDPSHTCASAR